MIDDDGPPPYDPPEPPAPKPPEPKAYEPADPIPPPEPKQFEPPGPAPYEPTTTNAPADDIRENMVRASEDAAKRSFEAQRLKQELSTAAIEATQPVAGGPDAGVGAQQDAQRLSQQLAAATTTAAQQEALRLNQQQATASTEAAQQQALQVSQDLAARATAAAQQDAVRADQVTAAQTTATAQEDALRADQDAAVRVTAATQQEALRADQAAAARQSELRVDPGNTPGGGAATDQAAQMIERQRAATERTNADIAARQRRSADISRVQSTGSQSAANELAAKQQDANRRTAQDQQTRRITAQAQESRRQNLLRLNRARIQADTGKRVVEAQRLRSDTAATAANDPQAEARRLAAAEQAKRAVQTQPPRPAIPPTPSTPTPAAGAPDPVGDRQAEARRLAAAEQAKRAVQTQPPRPAIPPTPSTPMTAPAHPSTEADRVQQVQESAAKLDAGLAGERQPDIQEISATPSLGMSEPKPPSGAPAHVHAPEDPLAKAAADPSVAIDPEKWLAENTAPPLKPAAQPAVQDPIPGVEEPMPAPGTKEFPLFAQRAYTGRFSETKALRELWEQARFLDGDDPPYTRTGFNRVRDRFWTLVRDPSNENGQIVNAILQEAGFDLSGAGAPNLKLSPTPVPSMTHTGLTAADIGARMVKETAIARGGKNLSTEQRAVREATERALDVDHADPAAKAAKDAANPEPQKWGAPVRSVVKFIAAARS